MKESMQKRPGSRSGQGIGRRGANVAGMKQTQGHRGGAAWPSSKIARQANDRTDQVGKGRHMGLGGDGITHQAGPASRRRDKRREGVAEECSWLDSCTARKDQADRLSDRLIYPSFLRAVRDNPAMATGKRSFSDETAAQGSRGCRDQR